MVSAQTGFGIDRLRRIMAGRQSAVVGQSGVGKSSLLERGRGGIAPACGGRQRGIAKGPPHHHYGQAIAAEERRLRRRYARACGNFNSGTSVRRRWPAIYRDLRPFVSLCRFPNCTHTHEEDCAVKNAVADDLLDERRYESYCHLFAGDME